MPRDDDHDGLPVRHRLAGARHAVDGRAAVDAARPRRREADGHRVAVRVVRRHVHREPHARRRRGAPDVLVAYELEGKPLSSNHGGPARLYVAPMYGYKSCKWLERIELVDRGRARLLGGQRLRRRRLGRPQQRPRRRSRRRPIESTATPSTACTLPRFDRVERVVHWCTATLILVLLFTGRRCTSGRCRRWSGTGTLVQDDPRLLRGCCCRSRVARSRSACARARSCALDLGRLNRWTADDRAWWSKRRRGERAARQVQSRSEAERDVHRRGDRRHAGDRLDHAWFEPVLRLMAHGRDVRARLVRARAARRDHRAHHARAARRSTRSAAWCAARCARAGRRRKRPRWYAEVARVSRRRRRSSVQSIRSATSTQASRTSVGRSAVMAQARCPSSIRWTVAPGIGVGEREL